MAKDNRVYVWKDRKRIFGLPLTFTRYMLTDEQLFINKGFFNISEERIMLYRIMDVSISLKLKDRIFHTGDVLIVSSDKTDSSLVLENIKNARAVADMLSELVEKRRTQKGAIVREFSGDGEFTQDADAMVDSEASEDSGDTN